MSPRDLDLTDYGAMVEFGECGTCSEPGPVAIFPDDVRLCHRCLVELSQLVFDAQESLTHEHS